MSRHLLSMITSCFVTASTIALCICHANAAAEKPSSAGSSENQRSTQSLIGLAITSLDDAARHRYGISDAVKNGVVISSVEKTLYLSQRHVRIGEIIVEINQQSVHTPIEVEGRITALKSAGRNSVLLMISSSIGESRFVPIALDSSESSPSSSPVAAHSGPKEDATPPNPSPQVCSGSFADPVARNIGEESAKELAAKIVTAPAEAYGDAADVQKDQYLNMMVGNGAWIVDEDTLFDRFLNQLQTGFDQKRLRERDLPLRLRLILQARPALGVTVGPITPELSKALDLRQSSGAVVTKAPDRSSPAEAAGLRYGDVITKIDDAAITTSGDLMKQIGARQPGDAITLSIVRDGVSQTMHLRVGARSSSNQFVAIGGNRREIKGQLTACFPSLARATRLIADRKDEARLISLQRMVGDGGLSPTSCGEAITSRQAGDAAEELIGRIRGERVQKAANAVALALDSRVQNIAGGKGVDGGVSTDIKDGWMRLAEEFRTDLRSKIKDDGADIGGVASLIGPMSTSQTIACFPPLGVPFRQLAKVMQEESASQREQQRRAQAAVQQRERQQRQDAEAESARRPENALAAAYDAYIDVRQCYDAREGYSAVYISGPEMEQARTAVRRIEQTLNPKLEAPKTTDSIWEDVSSKRRQTIGRDFQDFLRRRCGASLDRLARMLNDQGLSGSAIKKDF